MTSNFDISFPVRGKNDIDRLQKITGYKVADLLAMSPSSDPYNVGTPKPSKHAEWFAGLWERFQWSALEQFHLRRGHYQVASVTDVIRSDGRPYLNDDHSGSFLNTAAKYARHLGLVDPTRIVDMKNTEKYMYSVERDYDQDEIGYWVEWREWQWCWPRDGKEVTAVVIATSLIHIPLGGD